MSAEPNDEAVRDGPGWGRIAGEVARQMGLLTNRSPTLKTVIERGIRFIARDASARELVFDTDALFRGFIAAGLQDADSLRYGNTASWFVAWLTKFIGPSGVERFTARHQMAPPEGIFGSLADGYTIVLSRSVRLLLDDAAAFSWLTIGRVTYEARHLFSAMIARGHVAKRLEDRKVTLSENDLEGLKSELLQRIMETPETGETAERWHEAFRQAAAGFPGVPPAPPPEAPPPTADGVLPLASDVAGHHGGNVLGTDRDARVLARLMCLDDAAPLAIAILGGWGSGKSTFMNRLDDEVSAIVKAEAQRLEYEGTPKPDAQLNRAKFIGRVVQIRFNAWQFVDSSLWVSLTAEFFDQLRAGGWREVNDARYAALVTRVNGHVHALNDDLAKKRGVVAEGGKKLLEAQQARDKAAQEAEAATGHAMGQAALDLLGDIYEDHKTELARLGIKVSGDTTDAVNAVVDAAKAAHSFLGKAGVIWTIAKARVLWIVVAMAILSVAAYVVWSTSHEIWTKVAATVAAVMPVAAVALAALAPALRFVSAVTAKAGKIAQSMKEAEEASLKELLKRETALREAAHEAAARQAAAQEAEHRLARYVDPDGANNPPRLLRYMLEDDPGTKALQGELGLIGRTRRLFESVNDIVQKQRREPDPKKRDVAVPDRIVLYIDDLDRCSERQVYAVLQAIHLLLAFELFVVVVGVDVEWVENALARSFGDRRSHGTGTIDRRQRASRYLEKIFQVAFWLNPLNSDGATGGSYAQYVRMLARRAAPSAATRIIGTPSAMGGDRPGGDVADPGVRGSPRSGDGRETSPAAGGGSGAVAVVPDALATIELEPEEIDFLSSPEIAAIAAKTPRAVKRLLNVYRLVRARLVDEGVAVTGAGGHPPAYPLIGLSAAIETGQPVAASEAFFQALSRIPEKDSLYVGGRPEAGQLHPELVKVESSCPTLRQALDAVAQLRNGILTQRDMLAAVRAARRYSFNRSG